MQQSKVKVWDIAVRVFHWSLTLLILGAFLTSEEDGTVPTHAVLGLVIFGLLALRTLWGFFGTRHARFSDFVKSPREVLAYARAFVKGRPPAHLGHNPLGAVMVIALLGLLAVISVTGAVVWLGPEWEGPLWLSKDAAHAVKEVHEGAAEALPWLLVFHVGGVLLSSLLERQNLVRGMFTGFKRAPVVLLGVMLGAAAQAATPPALLEEYAAEARAQSPTFQRPDAARGKRLFLTEQAPRGERVSCASCHTADPRGMGRTPAGKIVEPLAPAANPRRFTDRKQADKWFDRNCKQVVGRLCTPEEKGDVLSFLLSL
ncbi:MAG: cytochrome [Myxococcaceae bacterium]|nr:cytochrome [Myxococcaceae bacterium]